MILLIVYLIPSLCLISIAIWVVGLVFSGRVLKLRNAGFLDEAELLADQADRLMVIGCTGAGVLFILSIPCLRTIIVHLSL